MKKLDIKNAACYYYLKDIRDFYREKSATLLLGGSMYKDLKALLDEINTHVGDHFNTQDNTYKNLYARFQSVIEKVANAELTQSESIRSAPSTLDELFLKIYENKNQIKEKLAGHLHAAQLPGSTKELDMLIHQQTENTNKLSPKHPDNRVKAFFVSMLGFRYHPLRSENIPYMNEDVRVANKQVKNIRIGNQTQDADKINPTFMRYLLANARRSPKKQPFEYVYINLLKRDQKQIRRQSKASKLKDIIQEKIKSKTDQFVRKSEGARSGALELLNLIDDLKVAVITLPADNDFLLDKFRMANASEKDAKKQPLDGIYTELLLSIANNQNDFFMTKKVKKALFGPEFLDASPQTILKGKLGELFKKSVFEMTGKQINSMQDMSEISLSPKERNAILFHFIKFHLTSHIINKLNPSAFNTSCKDGIDRGAVHSLWLTLNSRYEAKNPLSEREFLSMLESPAMIVKFRGINHNKNLIWNALNERMAHDPHFASAHTFLTKWVKENDPHKTHEHETRKSFISSRKEDIKKGGKDTKQDLKKLVQGVTSHFKPTRH